ncbi:MAG TPA: DHA2 family efflux MFS transporter permease subunit [Actinomycetota bacterium]|nr:DHA2 family efflux MFS transporter permease subunit [Actinomycetota bacterium]
MPATARKRQLLTLGACCFGLFMVMLDNTVVNVALPSLQRELEATVSGLALVLDAYILVFASLLLTAGSLGDRFGRRRVFRVGLVVFTASSALCGLAPTLAALVGGRALQAVGAAALLPSSLAILTDAFPDPRQRVQAIGLWSGVSAMALAAGPVIGGLLTDALGWRWVFYVNLPVGVAAFVVTGRVVAESRDPAASRLDLPGLLLGSLGLGAVTLGLIEGNQRGWGSPGIVGLLAAGVGLLAAFAVVEARRPRPMLSLSRFRDPAFSSANAVVLLAGFALLGFVFFNTLYFQAVQGWSPLQAGLRSLPNTLAVVVTAPLAGRLASRCGYRVPVVAGLLLAAAALLALTGIAAATPYAQLWWKLSMLGAGLGLSISPATAAGVAAMPGTQAGVASAVISTSRQVGGALGVAVLGAVAAARYGGATPEAAPSAFLAGVRAAYLVAAAALAVGAVAAWLFLRPRRAAPDAADPPLPAEAA